MLKFQRIKVKEMTPKGFQKKDDAIGKEIKTRLSTVNPSATLGSKLRAVSSKF